MPRWPLFWMVVWAVFAAVFQYGLRWDGLRSLGASAVCMAALGGVTRLVQATWPPAVPPELAEDYQAYVNRGWRRARVHRWWECTAGRDGKPHVHLVNPALRAPGGGRARTTLQVGH